MRLGCLARPFGVAAAILVAATASCSSPDAGGGANAVCNSSGVTADQVKLGFVFSDSGTGSTAFSSARSGIDARIGLANEEGGIHGRRIVYDWRDDGNSPSQNARVTEELAQQESVFGLVTATTSIGGSLDTLATQGVPVVGLALPAWAKYQNFFSNLYEFSPQTLGRYIQASGGTKVAFVTTGASAITMENVARYKAIVESIGLTVVGTISYASASDSPTRIAGQLANVGADSILGFTTPDDFAAIMQAVRAVNLRLAVSISLAGYDRGLLPTLGPALAGVSFPVYFRPFEAGGAPIERYREAMTRFAPQAVFPEQQFAMYAYIYTDMFLRGLEVAGACPTREGFISALRGVTGYDAGGLIEPVDLRDIATKPLTCNAFVQISPAGDEFQVVRIRLCADGGGA
ncbi:putative Leu/Ile/Val-binding lipoprotein transmembrane [Parafrankia sp. EAN1pec]|uniref:ABC transporter substrate-binding protein n=1 Tax=Parafrankia sp. (strain EAN1pec) TaxID=298653 RepID=UPI000054445C|nr:putative Leu/Ile/Val-binding lipoprotein transmembrane [Frankia sp. EAN1pec]